MVAINNGVIKNTNELSPASQKYLKKLTEKLELTNESTQFNIGFLYTYGVKSEELWENAKSNIPKGKRNKIKKAFPSVKDIKTTERQKKTISEIVALIQNHILTEIQAKEEKHLESCESIFNRRRSLANFLKKLTIGIFGSTFIALATAALIAKGYISLPVIMPIITPIVALVIASPIIASAALVTVMTILFLSSWKAVSSKRNAEHTLAQVRTQTQQNISSVSSAMNEHIIPAKSPSIPDVQSGFTTTVQRGATQPYGEDVVDHAAPPSYSTSTASP